MLEGLNEHGPLLVAKSIFQVSLCAGIAFHYFSALVILILFSIETCSSQN